MITYEGKALPRVSQWIIRLVLGSQEGGRVCHTINQWFAKNGAEWAVARLKALRTAALQLRSGNPDIAKKIYQDNSIAYYHGSLLPRGCYGRVFTLFLQAQRPVVLRRLEAVLRVYTGVRLPILSEKQYLKAKKSINTPYQGSDEALSLGMRLIEIGWRRLQTRILTDRRQWILSRVSGNPKVGRPSITRLSAYTSTHRGRVGGSDMSQTPYGKAALSIATCTCWPEAFRDLYDPSLFDFVRSRVWSNGTDNDYCGHISFLQEGGAKARVVAVPSALLQWGFTPLHDCLDRILQAIPTSGVHDQTKGAFLIERALMSGNTCWCFDLSSATDRFPLQLQIYLLRLLDLGKYADALSEICSEDFRVSTRFGEESWQYNCGQPMGLYGSFPLFSLAHLCLVEGLCQLGEVQAADAYCLVGDDVIILDQYVAEGYREVMNAMGVEISETKTMQSSSVAEFAGFVGYRTNRSVAVFRPFKHKDANFIHNPIGLIHALGDCLRRTESDYWDDVVTRFQLSRRWRNPDLSPILKLSEDTGGVNPPVIDTTRLENLLEMACAKSGTAGNSWTGEEYDLFDLGRLANILLGKQDDEYTERYHRLPSELLSTPDVERVRNDNHSYKASVASDPLMSKSTLEVLEGVVETPPTRSVANRDAVGVSLLELAEGIAVNATPPTTGEDE